MKDHTLSGSCPGQVVAINLSTHAWSALEVVACQRYKQLNCVMGLDT